MYLFAWRASRSTSLGTSAKPSSACKWDGCWLCSGCCSRLTRELSVTVSAQQLLHLGPCSWCRCPRATLPGGPGHCGGTHSPAQSLDPEVSCRSDQSERQEGEKWLKHSSWCAEIHPSQLCRNSPERRACWDGCWRAPKCSPNSSRATQVSPHLALGTWPHAWQCTGSYLHLHWLLPLPGVSWIFCCGDAQRMYEPSLMECTGCSHLHHLSGKASRSTPDMRQDFALVMFPFALENKMMWSSKKVLWYIWGLSSRACLWLQFSLESLLFVGETNQKEWTIPHNCFHVDFWCNFFTAWQCRSKCISVGMWYHKKKLLKS